MAENVFIHDSADKVPPPMPGRHPLTPISGADFAPPVRPRWPVQAWIVLTAILAAVLLWLGYRLDAALRDLFERYPWAGDALLWLLVLAAGLAVLGGLLTLAARAWVNIQHLRVVRSRLGTPQDVVQVVRQDPYAAEAQAIALETVRAQYMQYPNLSTLSQPAAPKAVDVPQLPAPVEPSNRLTFDAFWSQLDQAAHIGIFGMSQAGKTTLARALLNDYLLRGDQVMAISLAADREDWPIPVIGDGGEAAIVEALAAIRAELTRRENARERDGVPIRIFVDELTSATADKAVYEAWAGIMAAFMTRSRHVQMYLVVMAHDNTSGVFAAAGKARLIKNFMQIWCVREQGRRLVRIDEGLTLDEHGRQVRQVWQLDDTAPIVSRANRRVPVPEGSIFLTEGTLRATTPTTENNANLLESYLRTRSYGSYAFRNGNGHVVDVVGEDWACPFCGAPLRNRQQFSIAHRYGWCDVCKPEGAA